MRNRSISRQYGELDTGLRYDEPNAGFTLKWQKGKQ